jgi:hypothetical protein
MSRNVVTHLEDVGHVLSVRVFAEERRCSNNNIYTIHTSLDGDSCVVHMASDVGEDLGLESELADGFAVLS